MMKCFFLFAGLKPWVVGRLYWKPVGHQPLGSSTPE